MINAPHPFMFLDNDITRVKGCVCNKNTNNFRLTYYVFIGICGTHTPFTFGPSVGPSHKKYVKGVCVYVCHLL